MRHGKVFLLILLCCLFPLTAYAENKKVIVSCAELTSIEFEQPPPGYAVPREECGDKCFFIVFTMENATAHRVNAELNAYKQFARELYIDDHLWGILEPFHIDLPYSQKISSVKVYSTLESAMDDARAICPNATIRVPDTVRR